MERRNEKVNLDALKDRVAKLENELDMAFRRIKALLTENKELREDKQKFFDLYVRECSKNRPKEKVAGWRKVNPEGLKTLSKSKEADMWKRISPQILKMAQNKGKIETWTPKRLGKFADILDRYPI